MPAAASPFALVIDNDDHRRIETLHHLLRQGYRVTACSSLKQAEERLRHLNYSMTPPQLVIVAEAAEREGGQLLSAVLRERFWRLCWVVYPNDRDLAWLGDFLGSLVEDGLLPAPTTRHG